MPKITQISAVVEEGRADAVIYGLGDDNKAYYWAGTDGWRFLY